MGGADDQLYYEEEAAREKFIEQTIKDISEDGVSSYLGSNGDAIDERVLACLKQADELLKATYFQPAVILAATAIELMVRFFLIRPLIQAAFLSEDWALLLTERVSSGRTTEDRRLLPKILELHEIKLNNFRLKDGKELWAVITSDVFPKRHRVVHSGEPAAAADAQKAIECAKLLRSEVVAFIATKYGFTLETTGCWHRSKTQNAFAHFVIKTPFKSEE